MHQSRFRFRYLTYLFLPIFILLGVFASNVARQVHIVGEFDYISRDTLPEAGDEIRLVPYEVAQRYARDSLQLLFLKTPRALLTRLLWIPGQMRLWSWKGTGRLHYLLREKYHWEKRI
ncbi:MAG: hypothetical protein Q7I94_06565 [Candidatus Contubernalis sp.]|nr:hypothetical protein [Candidatus Contubernalis sp.]